MTDYLFSVKKLVDRLNLQTSRVSGAYNSSRKKSTIKIPICNVSDISLSKNFEEVRYRHGGKNTDKEARAKRKKARPKTEISDPQTRRQSLYQVIKLNKEKLSGKHGGHKYPVSPATTASNSPVTSPTDKNRTIFEFNVYHTSDEEKRDSDPSLSFVYKDRKSPTCEDIHKGLLLSPDNQFIQRPKSPSNIHLGKVSSPNNDRSKSPEAVPKTPGLCDTVFHDWESPVITRKNSETSRTRLSISKSVPLSPPVSTEERSARQFCNFQLKLDTLRAELLAMRKADQELAKRLLNLYSEIQIIKVKNSCMNYSELIDEAMYEAEIADEFPDMCDAPQKFTSKLLTSHGVTSFNIHSRRFSCS